MAVQRGVRIDAVLAKAIVEHLLRAVLVHRVMHEGALLARRFAKHRVGDLDLALGLGLCKLSPADDRLLVRRGRVVNRVRLLVVLVRAGLARVRVEHRGLVVNHCLVSRRLDDILVPESRFK